MVVDKWAHANFQSLACTQTEFTCSIKAETPNWMNEPAVLCPELCKSLRDNLNLMFISPISLVITNT